jgi:hypothetical protein
VSEVDKSPRIARTAPSWISSEFLSGLIEWNAVIGLVNGHLRDIVDSIDITFFDVADERLPPLLHLFSHLGNPARTDAVLHCDITGSFTESEVFDDAAIPA